MALHSLNLTCPVAMKFGKFELILAPIDFVKFAIAPLANLFPQSRQAPILPPFVSKRRGFCRLRINLTAESNLTYFRQIFASSFSRIARQI
ncbi:hypothetical protein [uncultured Campylobacter sp.]|uniref:hypothetical protein n=1 Tax=uncultured Campylobacter sp. TaxID=218934 RepID=UPI0026329C6E|nr:hypothetical protein [uncultured Campylobacter sp.]